MDNTEGTEQKILLTAMEVFVKKGRHGAKMQEIADIAGINKAMLHYYFRTKDKLYAKVFENVYAKGFGALHKVFETSDSFQTKLINFIDQYTNLILENPKIPLFILRELSEGADEMKPVFKEILTNRKFNLPFAFMQSIQTAIQSKEIKHIDPRQLFITTIGSIAFYFIAEPLLTTFLANDPAFNRHSFINERKKVVVDIILNGIKLR